jgi:hypothetical protein
MNSHVHKPVKPEPRIILDYGRDEAVLLRRALDRSTDAERTLSWAQLTVVNDLYAALLAGIQECDEYSR